ncbi:MAG: hypothetical protein PHG47_08455 [Sulfuricella sp.]|nr:hypothetical protein [Sulfuricella sp.]
MSQGNINILDLPSRAKAFLSEKNGTLCVQADNPVSALQAVARQAGIKILLSPADVARFTGAGKIDIVLSYANNAAAAMRAAKEIDDMATAAFAAVNRKNQNPSFWRMVGWLALATGIIAVGFAIAFAMLDAVSNTHTLHDFLRWF